MQKTMKRIYIKPSIELVNIETESLLAGLSKTGVYTWDKKDITDEVNLDINDKDGDSEDIICTKPNNPDLWDDDEW